MKKSYLIFAIIIIIILAGLCVFLNIKMLQYKKVIDYRFPMPETMVIVSGKITEIQANGLTIETTIQDSYNIPEKWKTKIVKVTITDETEIIKHGMGIFEEIEFSELKVEDQISARANENIKDKTEFIAKYIELYAFPETE